MGSVVVALGGNALLKRGEAMTAANQRKNAKIAATSLAPLCSSHDLIITHGNGPQVGLLALQDLNYEEVDPYPLDVLGAETEGMIGYMIEQELGNLIPMEKHIATILTMAEVFADDPAFNDPTKFVGKVYSEEEAKAEAKSKGWQVKPDGKYWRRVVPSPLPRRIFQIDTIKLLLENGRVVIAAGGGGIPTMYDPDKERTLIGVECVIDKDRASALLATDLKADFFVIATDTPAVFVNWATPDQKAIRRGTPDHFDQFEFPAGSMGPKVEAAQEFVRKTGNKAIICDLDGIEAALKGEGGTTFDPAASELEME